MSLSCPSSASLWKSILALCNWSQTFSSVKIKGQKTLIEEEAVVYGIITSQTKVLTYSRVGLKSSLPHICLTQDK